MKWIDVKKQMPDDEQKVIIRVETLEQRCGGGRCGSVKVQIVHPSIYRDGEFVQYNTPKVKKIKGYVSHWMPMPTSELKKQ